MSVFNSGIIALLCVVLAMATASDLSSSSSGEFQQLDVHLKLSAEILDYVEGDLSNEINKLAPHNEVDFKISIPHITLYLTEYMSENISDVVDTMNRLVPHLAKSIGTCPITFGKPFAQGQYFMWRTEVPACMQQIVDNLTIELCKYRNVDQEVPDWVYTLPEPQRSERIQMVRKYGSPNVFQYFDPHLTLAWSDVDDLTQLTQLNYPQFVFNIETIGLGVVGDHGTVLRGKDIAQWTFK